MTPPSPRLRLLRGDEATVYDACHTGLRHTVRRAVSCSDADVDDACAFAWLQFLRRQPERSTAFAWLCTVAIREAWRLSRAEQQAAHLEDQPGWEQHQGSDTLEPITEARRLLEDLTALPQPQLRALTLIASGHTHAETAAITGTTSSRVNKQLVRARKHLRAV